MRYRNLEITVPKLTGEAFSEVEVLGAATWLWMHSKTHSPLPIGSLATLLLPAIKHGQFLLASEQGKPVVYVGWGAFSEAAETRYIKNPAFTMPEADWDSGDRIWILDWVAPFGHTCTLGEFVKSRLFVDRCVRGLYHRGADKGLRIMQWHGTALLPEEVAHWNSTHPISKN